MHGAGSGVLKELLGEDVVVEINGERNPLFGGQAPEPIESKMQLLSQTVVSKSCDLGIAADSESCENSQTHLYRRPWRFGLHRHRLHYPDRRILKQPSGSTVASYSQSAQGPGRQREDSSPH